MGLGKYPKAIPYFEKVAQASGQILSEEAQINIGRCYEAMEDFSRALAFYQEALNEHPDSTYRPILKGKISKMLARKGQKISSEGKEEIKDEGKEKSAD